MNILPVSNFIFFRMFPAVFKILRLQESRGGRTDKYRHLFVLDALAIIDF